MYEFNFEWDPEKARTNLKKHGIGFETAVSVFRDPLMLSIPDDTHSGTEDRWITLGETGNGKLVVVVHTFHEVDTATAQVRIISARPATKQEQRQYREEK